MLIIAGNIQGFAMLEGAEGLLAIVTTEVHQTEMKMSLCVTLHAAGD